MIILIRIIKLPIRITTWTIIMPSASLIQTEFKIEQRLRRKNKMLVATIIVSALINIKCIPSVSCIIHNTNSVNLEITFNLNIVKITKVPIPC